MRALHIVSNSNMVYYCNGCGDAFYWDENGIVMTGFDPDMKLVDEHIPALLRGAYNNVWREDYIFPCYIMEALGKPYLALIGEFGDSVRDAQGNYFRGEDLKLAILNAAKDLEKKLAANEESGVEIFFPEDTDIPFCQWELVVAIPADCVTTERMTRIAAMMDESFKTVNYILVSHIHWDIDEWRLPENVNVPVAELLESEESEADMDRAELLDRIADWLYNKYGFCVSSMDVE